MVGPFSEGSDSVRNDWPELCSPYWLAAFAEATHLATCHGLDENLRM